MRERGLCLQLREIFSTAPYFIPYCYFPDRALEFVLSSSKTVCRVFIVFRVFWVHHVKTQGQEFKACQLRVRLPLQSHVSPEWAHMVTMMERVLITQRKHRQFKICRDFRGRAKVFYEESKLVWALQHDLGKFTAQKLIYYMHNRASFFMSKVKRNWWTYRAFAV